MRRLFEHVSAHLKAFIAQRDDLALVVRVRAPEAAYVLKMLQGLDEASETELHFAFAEDFQGAVPYVQSLVAAFQARHDAVRALQEKEGAPVWPALPPAALDPKAPPVERLKALMVFSRGLLPAPTGFDVVWVLFPLVIDLPGDWARFLEELLRHEHPVPWCHHMRVFVRDDAAAPALKALPAKVARVREYPVDLGPAAIDKALEEEAADDSLPVPERLQNLLLLAGTDFSHKRYQDSLAKYRLILKYFTAAGNASMMALALNGMGECYDKLDKPREAKAQFECALTPAMQVEAKVVLLNVVLNLANLHLKHNQLADAESYYDSAAKLAKAQAMPQVLIQARENQGICQHRQGKVNEAIASWDEAQGMAKAVEEKELRKRVLGRIQEHWRKAGNAEKDRAVTRELQAIA